MRTEATYEAVALLFPIDPEADTELCSQVFVLPAGTNLKYLRTVELARTHEDCYYIYDDLVTFSFYLPSDVTQSPQEYLAERVAVAII